jgi:hypothetical protein
MHTFEVFGTYKKDLAKPRVYTYPEAYDECTPDQLAMVAAIQTVTNSGDSDEEQIGMRLRLLRELAGIPVKYFGPEGVNLEDLVDVRMDDMSVERFAFMPSLDWAFKPPVWQKSVVPEIHVGKSRFQGPTDRLSKFTLLQWIFCDNLLQAFHAGRTEEDLNKFLAALYYDDQVEDTETGALVYRWNSERIDERAQLLSDTDEKLKLAAVMNYQGLRGWVVGKYKRCFRGGDTDPHGPIGMVVRLAGPKFGTTKEVKGANMHEVFVHVDQSIMDAEALENQK